MSARTIVASVSMLLSLSHARFAARGGPVPPAALSALQARVAEARGAAVTSSAATPAWGSIGPAGGKGDGPDASENDAGRMVAVVVDATNSQIVYAAVAGGGVWKCANADPAVDDWSWTPLTDDLAAGSSDGSIAPGSLAADPADPRTLWLALGDPFVEAQASNGFYVTHDGGAHWTKLPPTFGGSMHTRDLLPLTSSTLLIATDTGLWRSTDAGQSFTRATLGALSQYEGWSLRSLGAGRVVATVQDDADSLQTGSLWWSADAGASWSQASIGGGAPGVPGRIAIDTAVASTSEVLGFYEDQTTVSAGDVAPAGLIVSHDGGRSFGWQPGTGLWPSETGDGQPQYGYSMMISVDPRDPSKVFAGTNFAVYRSIDTGASWEQVSEWYGNTRSYLHADVHAAVWSSGALFVADDGGLGIFRDPYREPPPTGTGIVQSDPTFLDNRHNKGLVTELLYAIGSAAPAAAPGQKDLISAGAQDNGDLVRRPVSAGDWSGSLDYDEIESGDGTAAIIHPVTPGVLLSSIYSGFMLKSTDAGQTWNQAGAGLPLDDEGFYTWLVEDPAYPTGDVVFHPSLSHVYQSNDFGDTFTRVAEGGLPTSTIYIRGLGVSALAKGTWAIVAAGSTGYVTTDAGSQWRQFGALPGANPLYPGGQYDDVQFVWFDSFDDRRMFAASDSLDATSNHLWTSTDRGATWKRIDSAASGFPFGLPVYVVKNDPRNRDVLYAGTEVGVYRSLDAGASWTRFADGLPWVAVRDLQLAPDGSWIRAATYGRGIWESDTGAVPADPGSPSHRHGCSCEIDPRAATSLPAALLVLAAAITAARRARLRRRPVPPQAPS